MITQFILALMLAMSFPQALFRMMTPVPATGVSTPTLVQVADCTELQGYAFSPTSGQTVECRFAQPTLGGTGDLIVGGFADDSTSVTATVSDDASNGYTIEHFTDTTNTEALVEFFNVGGLSAQRITFNITSTTPWRKPWLAEFSGVGSFDKVSTGNSASSTTVADISVTPAQSGELFIQQAFDDYHSTGTVNTFAAGSQTNITWQLLEADNQVADGAQWGIYSGTAGFAPTMSNSLAGYVTQTLLFKPGTGPAIPTGIRVVGMKHFWLTSGSLISTTSPLTQKFPCPSNTNVVYIGFIGAHNNSDDLTAVTVNSHALTATGPLYNPVGDSQIHSWYAENVTFSPAETVVLTGTFTTGSAIGYCIVSPNPASSFQQRAEFNGNSTGTGASLTTAVSPTMTPNFANDLVIGEVGIANNTLRGVSTAAWKFNSEWWSGQAISNGGLDQNNGWGIFYNPSTASISTLSWPVQSSTLAVGNWAADIVEFH